MKKILFVDDEIQILKTLNRIFMDSGHQILLAESADAALKVLSEHTVDMVVTDMRMPGMDGVELLKIIKQKYPKTVRLILSGYADGSEIMYTLQNNLAKAYMFKPWKNNELISVIEQNLEDIKTAIPKEIISYINNLEQLPTIHRRYQTITNAINQDKDIGVIAAEIEKDQIISAKVLQIVNSAYYGIRTGSVKKALSFIGFNDLQNLVLSIEIMNCLSMKGAECLIAENIWNHANFTNKIQHIIQNNFLSKKSNHYDTTAGLLHKIGIVFMIKYYKNIYTVILAQAAADTQDYLYKLEMEKFGFCHLDLSAYLLRWWNAPTQIAEAAGCYISPLDDAIINKDLACIVHLAQHYASDFLNIKPFCDLQVGAFDQLGIDRNFFEDKYKSLLEIKEGII